MAYQNADTPDRLKAVGGVLVVHAALAALILSGLGVTRVTHTVERLKTFEIRAAAAAPAPAAIRRSARQGQRRRGGQQGASDAGRRTEDRAPRQDRP